jgi:hypothetical protein
MAKSKESVETAGFQPKEGEEGYVHVLVTQVPGETLTEPKVMAFHPNVYEQSISKTPGFVGEVIHDPKGQVKKAEKEIDKQTESVFQKRLAEELGKQKTDRERMKEELRLEVEKEVRDKIALEQKEEKAKGQAKIEADAKKKAEADAAKEAANKPEDSGQVGEVK